MAYTHPEPNTEAAHVTEVGVGWYSLKFAGIEYKPTDNPVTAGTLLFGLEPCDVKAESESSEYLVFLAYCEKSAAALTQYATDAPPGPVSPHLMQEILKVVEDAAMLAPTDEIAETVRLLLLSSLGLHEVTEPHNTL